MNYITKLKKFRKIYNKQFLFKCHSYECDDDNY